MKNLSQLTILALAICSTGLADSSATLNTGQSISFDTFTVGANGDATFTGTALTFASGVKAYNWGPMGSSFYQPLNGGELAALNADGTNNPIPLSKLVAGDVFSVLTKGGNVADALVTASSSSSLSFRYGTFVAGQATPVSGPPTISAVISAGAYGGFPAAAPGSWVEIYGSNLAPDTRQWAGSDFNGNNAPTSLDGVEVSIDGQKAFIDYISSSPGQINAQLPSNISTGPMLALTVNNGTVSSAPFNVTVNATEPGFLAPSTFLIGGNQYVVALLPDGMTYILPAGAIAGVLSRPVHPGETITMYGIGFGAVMPSLPGGEIETVSNQLSASLQILFGPAEAQITYAGLAPQFVGLYQFDVVVPEVPDNDLVPLTFNLGGATGNQTLFIAVQQ